jgi:hypothetical protein
MAIVQISKIQVRTGAESDLPQLDIGELGFATDTKNAYIGNDPLLDPPVGIQPTLTKLLTDSPNCHINASQLTGIINVDTGNIRITGGVNGYALTTDGTGNLSWSAMSGGGGGGGIGSSYNKQLLFNDSGSLTGNINLTYEKTTNTLNVINVVTSNITGTLTVNSNAQPNITSVGTLISLTVTGNITSGNANLGNLVVSNYFSGSGNLLSNVTAVKSGTVTTNAQPNITSTGTLTSLTVSGTSTLGVAGNVKISGGGPGQLLSTDGLGNLSWTTVSGGTTSVYGDSNVTTLLNSGFFNTTFIGSIPNSVHANYAEMANGVAGANVTGQVSNALIAGTVYTNAQPNITSVGTLANLTVIGNIGAGNITVGNVNASYLKGNGSSITGSVTNAINLVAGGTINGTVTAVTQLTTDNSTKVATTAFVQSILGVLYPIGSVYINATVNTNPLSLLGFGTWQAFGNGKVLVGVDGGDALFNTVGNTGGSKDAIVVSHTHTLSGTTGAMSANDKHSHYIGSEDGIGSSRGGGDPNKELVDDYNAGNGPKAYTNPVDLSHTHSISGTTSSVGSSGTNNNLQPYIVVYMWKRTA